MSQLALDFGSRRKPPRWPAEEISLDDFDPRRLARKTDPASSHRAARRVEAKRQPTQAEFHEQVMAKVRARTHGAG
jgi:hypothetical protein